MLIRNSLRSITSRKSDKQIELGQAAARGKVEAPYCRFRSNDSRSAHSQVMDVIRADSGAYNVRHDWRERAKVLRASVQRKPSSSLRYH